MRVGLLVTIHYLRQIVDLSFVHNQGFNVCVHLCEMIIVYFLSHGESSSKASDSHHYIHEKSISHHYHHTSVNGVYNDKFYDPLHSVSDGS